jgi:phytoene synthase
VDVTTAYRHCEQVTSVEARNFSYGIKLLPPAKRRALSAVYAFARRIDDIGDDPPTSPSPLTATQKLAALADARTAVQALASGGQPPDDDPVLVAVGDAARRFPIPVEAFGEIIDGCVADVRGTSYATFDELLHYCRCVAGSVGRLSLGIFGAADQAQAAPLADALGVALQLTNILRDIREDYQNGRVYLPAEDLGRFGCRLDDAAASPNSPDGAAGPVSLQPGQGVAPQPSEPLARLVGFEAERARSWYATGMQLIPLLDRRSAASAGAMAGIYRRLLERIAAAPAEVLRGRMSLSTGEKVTVAVRSLAGMAVRPRPPHPPAAPRPLVTPAAHSALGSHGTHGAYEAHSAYGAHSAEAADTSGASGASS